MRKLIVFNSVTVDGFFTGTFNNGNVLLCYEPMA